MRGTANRPSQQDNPARRLSSIRPAFVLLLGLTVAGCGLEAGTQAQDTGVRTLNSQVVLSTPPKVAIGGATLDGRFGSGSTSSSLMVAPRQANGFELSFPGLTLLLAEEHVVGGVTYLFVGGVDANDSFQLYGFHDSNADGVVDASTKALILTSGATKLYVTDIAIHGVRWYFLDRRCQDVWVADATGGMPSSLLASPFCRSADHSELMHVRYVIADSATKLLGRRYAPAPDVLEQSHRSPVVTMEDTTGDFQADTVSTTSVDPWPIPVGGFYEGQTVATVASYHSGTIEVWTLDSSHAEDQLLGSAPTTATSQTPQEIAIGLSPAISEGDRVRVRYATESTGPEATARGDYPELLTISAWAQDYDVQGSVVIRGENLTTGMTLTLTSVTTTQTPVSLSYVLDSPSQITATIPALGASWAGWAEIVATVPGQAHFVGSVRINIVAP